MNYIYPSIKGKRRSSESKKKGNIGVQQSNATPTPEAMLFDQNLNYEKYKEYEKFTALKKQNHCFRIYNEKNKALFKNYKTSVLNFKSTIITLHFGYVDSLNREGSSVGGASGSRGFVKIRMSLVRVHKLNSYLYYYNYYN